MGWGGGGERGGGEQIKLKANRRKEILVIRP